MNSSPPIEDTQSLNVVKAEIESLRKQVIDLSMLCLLLSRSVCEVNSKVDAIMREMVG